MCNLLSNPLMEEKTHRRDGRRKNMERLKINLQLFAEGGAAGGAGAAGGTAGAGTAGEAGANQSQAAAVTTKRANNNPLANVRYGKQEQMQDGVQQSDAGADNGQQTNKMTYDDFIKGEFKEEHNQNVEKIVKERLKNQKQVETTLRQQIDGMNPVLEMLAAKYGVEATDAKALMKAIEEDNAYYEAEAAEKGVDVEQLKRMKKMEQENTALRRKMQETMQQDQIRRDMEEWVKQGEEVKKLYPSFDFATESQNRDFNDLIVRGIPVQTAYEIVHKDEIFGGVMQYAAQQTAQRVSQNIQSRAKRPSENGISSDNGVVTKTDVKSLTKADRAEIARRVARGERITF